MTVETHGFIRVPPDSTGKRITHSVLLECTLKNVTNTPDVGERCSFGTSGLMGTISEAEELIDGSWEIHVSLVDPVPNGTLPILNEDFFENDIKIGEISVAGNLFYLSQNVIAGGKNNVHLLDIDDAGAASVRFTEGSPQFDSFGKMQVSNQTSLGDYTFGYDLDENRWNTISVDAGEVSYESNTQNMLLSVGTSTTDEVERITHQYHYYHLGTSQLIFIVAQFGDAGKTNNNRSIGYGDKDNGMFFQLRDSTFGILKKTKTTGSVVEEFIPKSQWNVDRLDGTAGVFNPSRINLDVTKINSYWIDVQWMGGSGRVRMGMFVNGLRILCHELNHSNRVITPFIPSASLPIYVENSNNGTTASSSELRVWSATVRCEGTYDPTYRHFSAIMPPLTLTSTDWVHLGSFRPAATYKGKVNRISGYGEEGNIFSTSAPFRIAILKNATLVDPVWTSLSVESAIEADMSASSITGGTLLRSAVLGPNMPQKLDLNSVFNIKGEVLRLHQDGMTQHSYSFVVQLLSAGSTNIHFTPFWKEI